MYFPSAVYTEIFTLCWYRYKKAIVFSLHCNESKLRIHLVIVCNVTKTGILFYDRIYVEGLQYVILQVYACMFVYARISFRNYLPDCYYSFLLTYVKAILGDRAGFIKINPAFFKIWAVEVLLYGVAKSDPMYMSALTTKIIL